MRQTVKGDCETPDVFTVLDIRGVVQDTSCSWESAPALEIIILYEGQVYIDRIKLRYVQTEYFTSQFGLTLRTEIL